MIANLDSSRSEIVPLEFPSETKRTQSIDSKAAPLRSIIEAIKRIAANVDKDNPDVGVSFSDNMFGSEGEKDGARALYTALNGVVPSANRTWEKAQRVLVRCVQVSKQTGLGIEIFDIHPVDDADTTIISPDRALSVVAVLPFNPVCRNGVVVLAKDQKSTATLTAINRGGVGLAEDCPRIIPLAEQLPRTPRPMRLETDTRAMPQNPTVNLSLGVLTPVIDPAVLHEFLKSSQGMNDRVECYISANSSDAVRVDRVGQRARGFVSLVEKSQ